MERIGDDHAIGMHGPVFVTIWEHATTPAGVDDALAVARAMAATPAPKIASLVVVPASSKLPDAEARRRLGAIEHLFGERNDCVAMVHEGTGFRAATVRGIITGMNMLMRKPMAQQMFTELAPAATWLDRRVTGMEPRALVAYVGTLRSRIPASLSSVTAAPRFAAQSIGDA